MQKDVQFESNVQIKILYNAYSFKWTNFKKLKSDVIKSVKQEYYLWIRNTGPLASSVTSR